MTTCIDELPVSPRTRRMLDAFIALNDVDCCSAVVNTTSDVDAFFLFVRPSRMNKHSPFEVSFVFRLAKSKDRSMTSAALGRKTTETVTHRATP